MALSYTDFAARFPELVVPTPSASEQTWIGTAISRRLAQEASSFWTTDLNEAISLAVAHEWIQYQRSQHGGYLGGGGAVSQESVGDWSLSWAVVTPPAVPAADAYWASTIYGLQYLALRARQLPGLDRVSL